MSALRLLLAAMACLLVVNPVQAKGFDFNDLVANRANPYIRTYDFIFPVLASAQYVKPEMSMTEKLDAAVSFVNFYSTPGAFERLQGLGTGMGWKEGATVMLRSGHLLCSEQSSLAAMMLEPYVNKVLIRDAQNHTFHEVAKGGRQLIVDPYASNHIRNAMGAPATFEDIQKWLNGDEKALQLPLPLTPRLTKYLSLFKSENYNSPRMAFGETFPIADPGYDWMVGKSVNVALYVFKQKGHSLNDPNFPGYRYYVRNNVYEYLRSKYFTDQAVWNVQDFFFSLLKLDVKKGALKADAADELFFARGYQLLGRYEKALEMYEKLPQSEKVDFFKSQCYYKLKDKVAFNGLAGKLGSITFYRYMYFRLNGEYLSPNDARTFDGFLYKDSNFAD